MTTIDVNRPTTTTATGERPSVELGVAGWFSDPRAQHDLRYFDGTDWTSHVTHRGPTPCSGCAD